MPSEACSKRWPKPGQSPGEVPNALLDCFSAILSRFWAPFASLELPFEMHGSLDPRLEIPFQIGTSKFKTNSIKCLMSWNSNIGTKEEPCHAWTCLKPTSLEVEFKDWKWSPRTYTSMSLSSKRIILNSCREWGHSSWLKSSSSSCSIHFFPYFHKNKNTYIHLAWPLGCSKYQLLSLSLILQRSFEFAQSTQTF